MAEDTVIAVLDLLVTEQDPAQLCAAWNFISHVIDDGEEVAQPEDGSVEEEMRRLFYERGMLDHLAREMSTRGGPALRIPVMTRAMVVLTMACLSSTYFKRVCDHPVLVGRLVELAQDHVPEVVGAYALTCLTNLAIHPAAHPCLVAHGASTVVQRTVPLLSSKGGKQLDCGLSAAFFMCRLTAKRDPNLVANNPLLIEKLAWILDSVLKAGVDGVVIGYNWNPANIVMDICNLIKNSTCNRVVFIEFIPLLTMALQLRSENRRMVRLTIIALLFLAVPTKRSREPMYPPELVKTFSQHRDALDKRLTLISMRNDDLETSKNASALRRTILDLDNLVKPPQVMVLCSSGNERLAITAIARLEAAGVRVTSFDAQADPAKRDETSTLKLYFYKPSRGDQPKDQNSGASYLEWYNTKHDFLRLLRLATEGTITHSFPAWDDESLELVMQDVLVACGL